MEIRIRIQTDYYRHGFQCFNSRVFIGTQVFMMGMKCGNGRLDRHSNRIFTNYNNHYYYYGTRTQKNTPHSTAKETLTVTQTHSTHTQSHKLQRSHFRTKCESFGARVVLLKTHP